jgi:predicted ATPase
LLAQQFERAGQNERAIRYWQQAGERDLRRFAMKESITHYSNALRLIAATPDTPERSSLELGICLGLGLAQIIAIGPTAKEPAAHYQRALTLSRALPGRGREQFLATWGIWFHCQMTGRQVEAFQFADELLALARELDDADLLLEAYHARIPGLHRRGDFPAMKEAAEEVMRRYDRQRHRDHAYFFGGHDARVCAQTFDCMALWGLGSFDQADRMGKQAIEDARNLGHTFSIAHALHQTSWVFILLGDVVACQAIVDELYPIAERNKFPWPLADAAFFRGWLAARQGDYKNGIKPMLHSAELPFFAPFRTFYFIHITETELQAGELDRATAALDRSAKEVEIAANHFCEPEIHRLRGEILLARSPTNAAVAETAFRDAMALAAQQSCRVLELRAATSLAGFLGEGQRRSEARDLLAPLCAAFTEGFDKADLQAANALLGKLR